METSSAHDRTSTLKTRRRVRRASASESIAVEYHRRSLATKNISGGCAQHACGSLSSLNGNPSKSPIFSTLFAARLHSENTKSPSLCPCCVHYSGSAQGDFASRKPVAAVLSVHDSCPTLHLLLASQLLRYAHLSRLSDRTQEGTSYPQNVCWAAGCARCSRPRTRTPARGKREYRHRFAR
jgi:hypothetical protein